MSGSKPVQLCKDLSSKGWELDVETLWEIMEPGADLPVAIYSIAGAFRKGKSFLLTLFLRYLRRASNGEGESWLNNVEEELEAGFEWRTGSERCTSGIWIWNTPFYIDTPEHGKVAVFLMDTQGAFDEKTSVQSILTIFALSTFVSSLQIFNIKEQIQQDSLQQLELFTEFAKSAKDSNPESHRGQPFQELLFLVRDWPNVDEGYGFENGAKELEKLLENATDCENIDSVRKNLKISFENLKCFLMNQPGKDVCRRSAKSSPLKIKDLGEDFLNDMDNLVKGIFSPDNLIIKKVNGNIINGHELREMSKTYSEIFGKGKMPKLGTIAEAHAKAAIEPVLREGQKIYREAMEKVQASGYVNPKTLQEMNEANRSEVLGWYDKQPKLGSENFKQEKKTYLDQQLEKRFDECKESNEAAKEAAKQMIFKMKTAALKHYNDSMEKMVKKLPCHNQNKLEDHHKRYKDEAMAMFGTCREGPHEVFEPTKKKLEEEIKIHFDKIKLQNEKNQKIELNRLQRQAISKYKKKFEESSKGKYLEDNNLESILRSCESDVFKLFEEETKMFLRKLVEDQRRELEGEMAGERENFEKLNQERKEAETNKIFRMKHDAMNHYNVSMEKYVEAAPCYDQNKLEDHHKRYKDEAMAMFEACREGPHEVFETTKKKLEEEIEIHFDKLQNEKSQEAEIGDLKSKIIRTFKTNLKTSTEGKYLEEEDLKEVLQKWESKAIESFEKETKRFHPELVKRPCKDFKIEMEDERKYIEQRNQEMKDIAKNEISMMKYGAIKHYEINMEKLMKQTPYQDEQELEVLHNLCKDEAMKKFETFRKGPQAYFKQMKQQLEEESKIQFEKKKIENEKKQEYELAFLRGKVFSSYRKNLEESSKDGYLEDKNLTNVLQKCHSEAIKTFEKETKMFLSKLVRQQRKKLDAEMNEEKTRFKKQNEGRREAEANEVLKMKHNAMKHYNDNMEKFVEKTPYQDQIELEAFHNRYKDEAMAMFETCKKGPHEVFETTKEELEEEIKTNFDKIKLKNEEKQKIELERLQSRIISSYKKNLEEATNGEYLRDESLAKVLEDCDSKSTKTFEEETKMFLPQLDRDQQNKLDAEMDEEKTRFKKQNQDRKLEAISKCCKKQADAVEEYKTKIDNCIDETPCQDQRELEARHDRYKDEAMEEFEKFKEVPLDDFNEQKKKLEEKIQDLFKKAERQNEENFQKKISALVAAARSTFKSELNQFWDRWREIIQKQESSIFKDLEDIISAHSNKKNTTSPLEFYERHGLKESKLKEKHEELLENERREVELLPGEQNQAEPMKRIEAALYEIGKDVFLDEVWELAMSFRRNRRAVGGVRGGTVGTAVGGIGVGVALLSDPIGWVAGASIAAASGAAGAAAGATAGYFTGKKIGKKGAFDDWREQ